MGRITLEALSIVSPAMLPAVESTDSFLDKRWNAYSDNSEHPRKFRRLSEQRVASSGLVGDAAQEDYPNELHQLPSPSLTKAYYVGTRSYYNFKKNTDSAI